MDFKNVKIVDPEPQDQHGRYLINALGQRELVVMQWRNWKYFDWLSRRKDVDIEQWVKECDLARGQYPLGDALADWLRLEFIRREREGLPRPSYMSDAKYDPLAPEYVGED